MFLEKCFIVVLFVSNNRRSDSLRSAGDNCWVKSAAPTHSGVRDLTVAKDGATGLYVARKDSADCGGVYGPVRGILRGALVVFGMLKKIGTKAI